MGYEWLKSKYTDIVDGNFYWKIMRAIDKSPMFKFSKLKNEWEEFHNFPINKNSYFGNYTFDEKDLLIERGEYFIEICEEMIKSYDKFVKKYNITSESWGYEDDLIVIKVLKDCISASEDFIKNLKKIKSPNEWTESKESSRNSIKESKKSARKSIKKSKNSSILDDELYDLIEQGYIYDEDENGMNMSYGEYVAVSDDLWETLENELEYYRDFPSAYDAYNEIMDNTSDDAKMFMGVSDDDYFYFEINEDENTYSFSGEVPTVLEKQFKKFLKETDFERV